MVFPLVVNPVSSDVEFISIQLSHVVDVGVIRTTAWVSGTTVPFLFRHNRNVNVECISVELNRVMDREMIFNHTFTGIGGVRFAPSFPQWDRQETSYPFAF